MPDQPAPGVTWAPGAVIAAAGVWRALRDICHCARPRFSGNPGSRYGVGLRLHPVAVCQVYTLERQNGREFVSASVSA